MKVLNPNVNPTFLREPGVNLNRVYNSCNSSESPTIHAVKTLLEKLSSRIYFYVDIHGHATENGMFVFGNPSEDLEFKVNTFLFLKLLSLINHRFCYSQCKTNNLTLQDFINGTNLDGCGRAFVHQMTGKT